jgi:hypothetical protein
MDLDVGLSLAVLEEQLCDRVSFFVREDGVVELRPDTVDIQDLFGILCRPGTRKVSVEEMNSAIRRAAARK